MCATETARIVAATRISNVSEGTKAFNKFGAAMITGAMESRIDKRNVIGMASRNQPG